MTTETTAPNSSSEPQATAHLEFEFQISRGCLGSALKFILVGFPICLIFNSILLYSWYIFGMQVVVTTYWLLLGIFLLIVDLQISPGLYDLSKKNAAFLFTYGGRAFLQLVCGMTMIFSEMWNAILFGLIILATTPFLYFVGKKNAINFPETNELKETVQYDRVMRSVFPMRYVTPEVQTV